MMTIETKNQILKLKRQNASLREISRVLGVPLSSVDYFLKKNGDVVAYASCPNCGKEIALRKVRGRPSMFCSTECKFAYYKKHGSLKKREAVCEWCGKKFMTYRYRKIRFCSRECANKSHGSPKV